jgi:acetyl esterase/lipase
MKSTTAVIVVHGGYDLGGSNDTVYVTQVANYLARRHIAVFAPNYRLARGSGQGWPAQWQDAQLMIRYVRSLGYKRVCMIGLSAGGYNTLGITFRRGTIQWKPTDPMNEADLYPGYFSAPDCSIAVSPFSNLNDPDFSRVAEIEITRQIARPITGMDAQTKAAIASPITHIRSDISPLIVFHGVNDKLVPYQQSLTLYREMLAIGGNMKFYQTPGGHLFSNLSSYQQGYILKLTTDCVLATPGTFCDQ